MRVRFACGFLIGLCFAGPALCQQLPSFEAAAIRPGSHPVTKEGYSYSDVNLTDARRFRALNADLSELIEWAYQVRNDRISGPDDIKSKTFTFDIDATVPENADKAQARLMLRQLLAERFAVVLHSVTKPTAGYSLVVDRGGAKLKVSEQEHSTAMAAIGGASSIQLVSPAVGIASLASTLSRNIDAPVVDQTHLDGLYDIDIQFSRMGTVESDAPTVFEVFKRLGLRLDKSQIPVESIIVDHANFRPTEN